MYGHTSLTGAAGDEVEALRLLALRYDRLVRVARLRHALERLHDAVDECGREATQQLHRRDERRDGFVAALGDRLAHLLVEFGVRDLEQVIISLTWHSHAVLATTLADVVSEFSSDSSPKYCPGCSVRTMSSSSPVALGAITSTSPSMMKNMSTPGECIRRITSPGVKDSGSTFSVIAWIRRAERSVATESCESTEAKAFLPLTSPVVSRPLHDGCCDSQLPELRAPDGRSRGVSALLPSLSAPPPPPPPWACAACFAACRLAAAQLQHQLGVVAADRQEVGAVESVEVDDRLREHMRARHGVIVEEGELSEVVVAHERLDAPHDVARARTRQEHSALATLVMEIALEIPSCAFPAIPRDQHVRNS
eukprot:7384565-Prymnesium_polylepis.1